MTGIYGRIYGRSPQRGPEAQPLMEVLASPPKAEYF